MSCPGGGRKPQLVYRSLRKTSALRMTKELNPPMTTMNPTVLSTSEGPGKAVFLISSRACSKKLSCPTGSISACSSSDSSSSGCMSSRFSKTLMSSDGSGAAAIFLARSSLCLMASAVATLFSMFMSAARARMRSFMEVNSAPRAWKSACSSSDIPEPRDSASASSMSRMALAASSKEPGPASASEAPLALVSAFSFSVLLIRNLPPCCLF
mmetsp:Transcript_12091/g.34576  ORF Transcript_12091/g.34576 Transcript_12091/m.34576 type:complete len:211 (-) Transcript_12091:229-861(-)